MSTNTDIVCHLLTNCLDFNVKIIVLNILQWRLELKQNPNSLLKCYRQVIPSKTQNSIRSSAETVTTQLLHRVLGPLHVLPGLVHHHLDVPLPRCLWSGHLLKS